VALDVGPLSSYSKIGHRLGKIAQLLTLG
jgi:hypothetical protein